MIKVTRINGGSFVINSDLIEFIEEKPETLICLTTGKKIMVRETIDEVVERIADFRGITNGKGLAFQKKGMEKSTRAEISPGNGDQM